MAIIDEIVKNYLKENVIMGIYCITRFKIWSYGYSSS